MTTARQGRAVHLQEHDDMTGEAGTPCRACGQPISTTVRGNTVRCRSCKAPNYIPKTRPADAAVIPLRADSARPAVWDPAPVPVVEAENADADCPDCGTPLEWSPGGTLHYCPTCEARAAARRRRRRPAARPDTDRT
jgi:uncharacterized Zn finger protein (UPF0148 family)